MTHSLQRVKCLETKTNNQEKFRRNSKRKVYLRTINSSNSQPTAVTLLTSFLSPHLHASYNYSSASPLTSPLSYPGFLLWKLSSFFTYFLLCLLPEFSTIKGHLDLNQASKKTFHFLPNIWFFSLPILLLLLYNHPGNWESRDQALLRG